MNGRIAPRALRSIVAGALCFALLGCLVGRNNPFDPGSNPLKVSLPYFSLADGTYDTIQQITIACNTQDVTIYHTNDESNPDVTSIVYTGTITIGSSMTLKAIATKAGLESSDIVTVVITYSALPPAAPSGLTPTAGDGSISLSWSAVTRADDYDVYYAAGTTATTSSTHSGPHTVTSATISGLTNGTQYAFVVTASNQGGESVPSDVITATPSAPPADTAPPAEVTGLAVGDGRGALPLSWADLADADFHHVEVTWSPGGLSPVTVAKGVGAYQATGLTNDTAYTLTVTTVDLAGNKSSGAQASGTPYDAVFVATTGASGNSGLRPTAAKSTIADGIAAAQAAARSQVRVAGGTYAITSTITVANGVSLLGGYSATFATRDASANTTAITDTRTTWASPNPAVLVSGATIPLTIDGFTITAASGSGSGSAYALQCVSSSDVTISHNVLNGGEEPGEWSIALLLEGCGGTVLQGNLIASVDSATMACSFPIWATDNTGGRIVGNRVVAGRGTTQSTAVVINGWTSLLIANNVILANLSPTSIGLFVREGTSILTCSGVVYNNTIDGGGGTGTAEAIRLRYSHLDIRNNIIVSTGGVATRCIRQEAGSAMCAAIRNNCFYLRRQNTVGFRKLLYSIALH